MAAEKSIKMKRGKEKTAAANLFVGEKNLDKDQEIVL